MRPFCTSEENKKIDKIYKINKYEVLLVNLFQKYAYNNKAMPFNHPEQILLIEVVTLPQDRIPYFFLPVGMISKFRTRKIQSILRTSVSIETHGRCIFIEKKLMSIQNNPF